MNCGKILTSPKKTVRIMADAWPTTSCRILFKQFIISHHDKFSD